MNVKTSGTDSTQSFSLLLSEKDGDKQYEIVSETLIGREVECSISLDSPHVSRYHAKILIQDNNTATIEDLNSSNGTFINGKRITQKTMLSVGDEIRFDTLAFRITTNQAGDSEATVMLARAVETHAPEIKAADVAGTYVPPEDDSENDNTRMLNTDQLNRAVQMNKRYEHIDDKGSGPRLIATTAPVRGKLYPLLPGSYKTSWLVGRNRDLDICVSDPSVSRHHATIDKQDGRFTINVEPTAKPILLNGEQQHNATLKHNDQVQIGTVEFVFRLDEQTARDIETQHPKELQGRRSILFYAVSGCAIALVLMALATVMVTG